MLGWFLGTRVGQIVSGIVLTIGAVLAVWFKGRQSAQKDAELDRLKDYRDTRGRMDDAGVSKGDADADAEWLKQRAQRPPKGK